MIEYNKKTVKNDTWINAILNIFTMQILQFLKFFLVQPKKKKYIMSRETSLFFTVLPLKHNECKGFQPLDCSSLKLTLLKKLAFVDGSSIENPSWEIYYFWWLLWKFWQKIWNPILPGKDQMTTPGLNKVKVNIFNQSALQIYPL